MLFIFPTPELIRHLWQLKTAVFLNKCLIRAASFIWALQDGLNLLQRLMYIHNFLKKCVLEKLYTCLGSPGFCDTNRTFILFCVVVNHFHKNFSIVNTEEQSFIGSAPGRISFCQQWTDSLIKARFRFHLNSTLFRCLLKIISWNTLNKSRL